MIVAFLKSCWWVHLLAAVGVQVCQRRRWNDIVSRDLRECELQEDWYELAQNRRGWRCLVHEGAELLNQRQEQEEIKRKDEMKARQDRRLHEVVEALKCPFPNCSFAAATTAGLTNHHRQKHQLAKFAQCIHCGKSFHQQGIYNHQKFCKTNPSWSTSWPVPLPRSECSAWMDGVCVMSFKDCAQPRFASLQKFSPQNAQFPSIFQF